MNQLGDMLEELRRMQLDRIAAAVVSEQTRQELWPVYSCGHRHGSRGEALACVTEGVWRDR